MNILDLIPNPSLMKRVSSVKGGEYHGPCPVCGGTDRFHVWPEQGERGGTYWCRNCPQGSNGGDAVAYLRHVEGLSCPKAFARAGLECDSHTCPVAETCRKGTGMVPREIPGGNIPELRAVPGGFNAPTRSAPVDIWKEKAGEFVDRCHQALLGSPAGLEWLLEKRGITKETSIALRLGLHAGRDGRDYYAPRSSWGLPEEHKADGKVIKLWIPCGLVIPCFISPPSLGGDQGVVEGVIQRIRIRRSDNSIAADPSQKPKRYIVVPGSSSAPLILPCKTGKTIAWIVVESELDAILLWQICGDLIGVMAMGNSSARPDVAAHELLQIARHISVALDYDARTNQESGKYENPGGKEAVKWWLPIYPHAVRTPIVGGKDPCDAWLKDMDLRAWVIAGLPPAFRILAEPGPMMTGRKLPGLPKEGEGAKNETHLPDSIISTESIPSTLSILSTSQVHTLTAKDGRTFHITDDPKEYARLVADKEIVFTSAEIALIKQTGADQDQAAVFLNAKQTFPGIKVTEVTLNKKGAVPCPT